MSALVNLLSCALIGAGVFFFLAGTVGLLRFPDSLTRLHALTKADNLGLGPDRARACCRGRRRAGGAQARRASGCSCCWPARRSRSSSAAPRGARSRADERPSLALDAGLGAAGAGDRRVDHRAREHLRRGRGLRRVTACCWRSSGCACGAPDVALTEAAIGSGLTGRAAARRGRAPARHREPPRPASGPARSLRVVAALPAGAVAAALAIAVSGAARSRADAGAAGGSQPRRDRPRQSGHRGADGLPRDRHAAREGRAAAGPGRRLVAGARPTLGRPARACATQADPNGVLAFLARLLPPSASSSASTSSGSAPISPGGAFQGGTILAAMWLLAMMAGLADAPPIEPALAAARAGRRAGGVPAGRPRGLCVRRRLPRLSRPATPSR